MLSQESRIWSSKSGQTPSILAVLSFPHSFRPLRPHLLFFLCVRLSVPACSPSCFASSLQRSTASRSSCCGASTPLKLPSKKLLRPLLRLLPLSSVWVSFTCQSFPHICRQSIQCQPTRGPVLADRCHSREQDHPSRPPAPHPRRSLSASRHDARH